MEGRDNTTLRITKKVKRVYEGISYHKKTIINLFLKKYAERLKHYGNIYRQVKGLPTGIVGYKYSITISGIDRETAYAFIGYIISALVLSEGDTEKAIEYIKRDLGFGYAV